MSSTPTEPNEGVPAVPALPPPGTAADDGACAPGGINSIMSAAYGLSSLSGPSSHGTSDGTSSNTVGEETQAQAAAAAAMTPLPTMPNAASTSTPATMMYDNINSNTMSNTVPTMSSGMLMPPHPQQPRPDQHPQAQAMMMAQHHYPPPSAAARAQLMSPYHQQRPRGASLSSQPQPPVGGMMPPAHHGWSPNMPRPVMAPGMTPGMMMDPAFGNRAAQAAMGMDPASQHHHHAAAAQAQAMNMNMNAMNMNRFGMNDHMSAMDPTLNTLGAGAGGRMTAMERAAAVAAASGSVYDPYYHNQHQQALAAQHQHAHAHAHAHHPGLAPSTGSVVQPMMGAATLHVPPTLPNPHLTTSGGTAGGNRDNPGNKNFPETLFDIISSEEHRLAVAWLPHGKGFIINDKQRFADHILPRYFDGAKFTSFTRRVKRWSFVRVARGPEMGAYYNKNFQRDRPDLVQRMNYRVNGGAEDRDGKCEDDEEGENDHEDDEDIKSEANESLEHQGEMKVKDEDDSSTGKKSPALGKRKMILPVMVHDPSTKSRHQKAKLQQASAPSSSMPIPIPSSKHKSKSLKRKHVTGAQKYPPVHPPSGGGEASSIAPAESQSYNLVAPHGAMNPDGTSSLSMPRRYPSLVSPNNPMDESRRRMEMERDIHMAQHQHHHRSMAPGSMPGAMGLRMPHDQVAAAGDSRMGPGAGMDPRMGIPPGGVAPGMPMAAGMQLHPGYYPHTAVAGAHNMDQQMLQHAEHAKRLKVENAKRVLAVDAAERAVASLPPPGETMASPRTHERAMMGAAPHNMQQQATRLAPPPAGAFMAHPVAPELPPPRLAEPHGGAPGVGSAAGSVSSLEQREQRSNSMHSAAAPVPPGDRLVPMSREEEAEYAEYLFMKQKNTDAMRRKQPQMY